MKDSLAMAMAMKKRKKMMMPESEEGEEDMPMHDDVIDRVMKKRGMYSEGGIVSNEQDEMADSKPAEYDDLVLDDHLESTNSGASDGDFLGNEQEDHDRHDIISRVMRSRAKSGRMPRPA